MDNYLLSAAFGVLGLGLMTLGAQGVRKGEHFPSGFSLMVGIVLLVWAVLSLVV